MSGGDTDSERESKEKEKIRAAGIIVTAGIYLKANSRNSSENDGISRMKMKKRRIKNKPWEKERERK